MSMNIDTQNPGTWPFIYKVILWIVIVAIIFGLFYQFKVKGWNELAASQQKTIDDSKASYEQHYKYQLALEQYKTRKNELLAQLEGLLRFLPKEDEVDRLIDNVSESGTNTDINFSKYQPDVRPYVTDYVDVQGVALETTTYYQNYAQFAQKLVELEKIMNMADFNMAVISSARRGRGQDDGFADNALVLSSRLHTYIYNQDIEALRRGELPKTAKK